MVLLLIQLGCAPEGSGTAPEHPERERDEPDTQLDESRPHSSDSEEPWACSPPSVGSATVATAALWDPVSPVEGDTLVVVARATDGTGRTEAPEMVLVAEGPDGTRRIEASTVEGGAAVWYFALPEVVAGELCLWGEVGGEVAWAGETRVSAHTPTGAVGAWRVLENHQWTCDEQPECGNYVSIRVLDEAGAGVPGAVVRVRQPDTTLPPITNDTDPSSIPASVTMDDSGSFVGQNWWPTHAGGLQVFELSVEGAPSDAATELTTGWWEDDLAGCNYCGRTCVNVWGHWSSTVIFQWDPTASETCVVENDHAGMSACGEPRHVHHADERACRAL